MFSEKQSDWLKFRYSEKATKIWSIFHFFLRYLLASNFILVKIWWPSQNIWTYEFMHRELKLSFINFTSIAKVFATSNLVTSPWFRFFILIRIPRGTNRASSFYCAASTIKYDTLISVTAVLELEGGKLIKI